MGVAGGTASGKTTVANEIFRRVRVGRYDECTLIPLDCFYKECTPEQMANIGKVNFDHPSMFDWDLVNATMRQLQRGEDVSIPDYDYVTCKRRQPGLLKKWSPLVIFEGIFGLLDKELNTLFDLKIFVHADDDIRLARRLQRDIVERGRTVEGVLKSYHRFVKPAFDEFVKPTMKYADIIVPRSRPEGLTEDNQIAVDFISHNLEHHLIKAGYQIEIAEDEILQVCCADELEGLTALESQTSHVRLSTNVLAARSDRENEWRGVLATLSDYGQTMGRLLSGHLAETLLNSVRSHELAPAWNKANWLFPQRVPD